MGHTMLMNNSAQRLDHTTFYRRSILGEVGIHSAILLLAITPFFSITSCKKSSDSENQSELERSRRREHTRSTSNKHQDSSASSAADEDTSVDPEEEDAALREINSKISKVTSVADLKTRLSQLEELVVSNAESDLDLAAYAYTALAKEGRPRREVTEYLARSLAKNDLDDALLWIKSLKDSASKSFAYGQLAEELALTSPSHAARLATKHLALGKGFDAVYLKISEQWAMQEPASAAAWLARFPDGDVRKLGFKTVFRHWSDSDVAKQWINTISNPSAKADALTAFSGAHAPEPAAKGGE